MSEITKTWTDIPVDDETLSYVMQYGGRCRDCADHFGVCPGGLPCESDEAKGAIRHVLRAINYGMANGFLSTPSASERK